MRGLFNRQRAGDGENANDMEGGQERQTEGYTDAVD
jgi:hypothetical protein